MGIKFNCPNGHKLNVKSFLAGRRGICPHCEARFRIPLESGGTAELVIKGEKGGGEETRLTEAMQDDPLGSVGGVAVATSPMSQVGGTYTPPSVADPISESPNAVWYVRPRSGGQYGPAAGDIMRDWINEGRVAGDSLVWCEGWPDWRQASSVFPQLAGALSLPTYAQQPTPMTGQAVSVGQAFPTGQTYPAGAVMPVGGAIPVGGVATAVGTPGNVGAAGGFPSAAAPSPTAKRAELRRKSSGSFTALIVIMLVMVALILAVVFAWILFGGPNETASRNPASHSALL